ncbi:MAG TPA: chromate transporter [Casimicrobiaceae bacterium]|nr:chromate transporter [Casimicrobiaceae bacterium]
MTPPLDDVAPPPAGRHPLDGVTRGALFASFLKMGLLGFGGVLPWARRVVVDERRWFSDREFAETMGLCQVLPGPNVVNLAVIVGSRSHGPLGALLAVTGILFVPIAVMLAMAIFYAEVANHPLARHAIAAASAAAAGLIVGTAVRLFIKARPPLRGVLTGVAAFIGVGVLHWPLVWVALALMAASIAAEWRASA